MYIAVSGNLGSGKTTLARALAAAFRCDVYPQSSYEVSYINDLFERPDRWTFEAQVSFLIHKYVELQKATGSGRLFVLDRTLDEEVQVFGQKFFDDGYMDERSMALLRQTYEIVKQHIPPPSAILFCDASVPVCYRRIASRSRPYQDRYPSGHLEALDTKLRSWIETIDRSLVVRLNTEVNDIRDPATAEAVAERWVYHLTRNTSKDQLDLFAEPDSSISTSPDLLDILRVPVGLTFRTGNRIRKSQSVYTAAPFTSTATRVEVAENTAGLSLPSSNSVERIGRGAYRRFLLQLANAVESHGYTAVLPHRDINRWGARRMSPGDVALRCLDAVRRSDFFVGLVGQSHGSHVELGVALECRLPIVILELPEFPLSFFAKGICESGWASSIRRDTIGDMIQFLFNHDCLAALSETRGR
jgi:deoxyadenosine/deoxycytidine kinase